MPNSNEELLAAFLRAPDQALLDCKTIAAWLGYSPRWLALRVESGDAPPSIRYSASRKLLFRKGDVVQWIADQTTQAIQNAEDAERASLEYKGHAQWLSNYLFPPEHGDRCDSLASHENKNNGEQ